MEEMVEEVLNFIEDILALGESLQILAVAPQYGAGELLPEHLQRLAAIITSSCESVIEKFRNYQN
jgi:hypothetical protein